MGRGSYSRTNAMQTSDMALGVTTANLRKLGGLKHGFPQAGFYTLTWKQSRTRRVVASMDCRITQSEAVFSFYLTQNSERKLVTLAVPFTWSDCNYGGKRTWFLCRCGQRVGRIFFKGEQYGCRHCLRLTYQSRRDCQINRAWGKIYNLRKRLKLDKSMAWCEYMPPPRPKWMQRRRYRSLCRDLEFWYYMKDKAILVEFKYPFPWRNQEPHQSI